MAKQTVMAEGCCGCGVLPGNPCVCVRPKKVRPPDPAWTALLEETGANPETSRGMLNFALKAIREAAKRDGTVDGDELATQIHVHAAAYRNAFPMFPLTPIALARHWYRVMVPRLSVEERALNRLAHPEHGGVAL